MLSVLVATRNIWPLGWLVGWCHTHSCLIRTPCRVKGVMGVVLGQGEKG